MARPPNPSFTCVNSMGPIRPVCIAGPVDPHAPIELPHAACPLLIPCMHHSPRPQSLWPVCSPSARPPRLPARLLPHTHIHSTHTHTSRMSLISLVYNPNVAAMCLINQALIRLSKLIRRHVDRFWWGSMRRWNASSTQISHGCMISSSLLRARSLRTKLISACMATSSESLRWQLSDEGKFHIRIWPHGSEACSVLSPTCMRSTSYIGT